MSTAPFEAYETSEEFRIARRFQDPDENVNPVFHNSRFEVNEFIRKKGEDRFSVQDGAFQQLRSTPYSPLHDAFEIRILEVQPGDFAAPIQGELHPVSLEFDYAPLENTRPVWKRTTRHAISLTEGEPICYTALSYVWGPPVFDDIIQVNGYAKAITRNLDTAIRYLRREDCSVMIFIDQVCINQDDPVEKAEQVQLMGLVYQRAWNTVIWLGEGPDCGAMEALKFLREIFQGREEGISAEERERVRCELDEVPGTLEGLVALFERPWFTRTWTIQEAVLSNYPYVMIGSSNSHWDDFGGYCVSIYNLGILDNSISSEDMPFPTTAPTTHISSGLQVTAELFKTRSYYHTHRTTGDILSTLVETRYADVTNPSDKVYSILGLCTHEVIPDYSKPYAQVFWEVTLQIIRNELKLLESRRGPGQQTRFHGSHIFRLLYCVDHEPVAEGIPSWVSDWSKPRVTTSLAYSTSTFSCFDAGGFPLPDVTTISTDHLSLIFRVKIWDAVTSLSEIYTAAYLSAENPSEKNKTLKSAIAFATSKKPPSNTTAPSFLPFCHTLVAGKSGSGREKYPEAYTQILSLLCDETNDSPKPTFPDQIYTPRQRSGHFSLANLNTRSTSRVFEDLKRAHEAAMVGRRLCLTEREGCLGLVPRGTEVGDKVVVMPGAAVPLILRAVGTGWRLVGEAYVDAIMHGEVMADETLPMTEIRLV